MKCCALSDTNGGSTGSAFKISAMVAFLLPCMHANNSLAHSGVCSHIWSHWQAGNRPRRSLIDRQPRTGRVG